MSNHSCIEHRANYHFLKLEEDYVLICVGGKQNPHCKAMILSVLESWTNDKITKGVDPYVYMTYPEWEAAMYGIFKRNTIISCLEELVEKDKLLERRLTNRYDKKSFEYKMDVKKIQAKVKALAERDEKYSHPNLNAFKNKRVQKQTISHPNLNDIPSKFKRNIDTNIDTTEKENTQNAHAFAQPSLSEEKTTEDLSPTSAAKQADILIARTTKKPRQPRKTVKRDELTQKRIDDVYDAMDAFKKKVMCNQDAKFRRDEKGAAEIEQMLTVSPAPTLKYLHLVAYDMWNQVDGKTKEHFWRDKMSPYNIAHQYEQRIMKLLSSNGHAKDPDEKPTSTTSVSGLKKYVASQDFANVTSGK